jgi:uncharacterized protein (TIGR02246 family)
MDADERAVRKTHTTWIEAVNAGDLTRLFGLMTDDAVFLNPGQAPVGREGFARGFSSAGQKHRFHCTSELEDVVVAGTVAYAWARDALQLEPRGGDAGLELAGHRLSVYRQQPDGRWLLARDAHTLQPVAR